MHNFKVLIKGIIRKLIKTKYELQMTVEDFGLIYWSLVNYFHFIMLIERLNKNMGLRNVPISYLIHIRAYRKQIWDGEKEKLLLNLIKTNLPKEFTQKHNTEIHLIDNYLIVEKAEFLKHMNNFHSSLHINEMSVIKNENIADKILIIGNNEGNLSEFKDSGFQYMWKLINDRKLVLHFNGNEIMEFNINDYSVGAILFVIVLFHRLFITSYILTKLVDRLEISNPSMNSLLITIEQGCKEIGISSDMLIREIISSYILSTTPIKTIELLLELPHASRLLVQILDCIISGEIINRNISDELKEQINHKMCKKSWDYKSTDGLKRILNRK